MKSFFTKIKNFFEKILGNPNEEQVVSATLTALGALAAMIATATGNEAAAPVILASVTKIQTSLAAVEAVGAAAGPNPSMVNLLNSAKTEMQSLLSAGQIKNPTTLSQVSGYVSIGINDLEQLITIFSPKTAAATAATATTEVPATETTAPAAEVVATPAAS